MQVEGIHHRMVAQEGQPVPDESPAGWVRTVTDKPMSVHDLDASRIMTGLATRPSIRNTPEPRPERTQTANPLLSGNVDDSSAPERVTARGRVVVDP
jgi:hypothetical protein